MAGPQFIASIRPIAAKDLEEIVCYLNERSETAADKFLAEFLKIGPVARRDA